MATRSGSELVRAFGVLSRFACLGLVALSGGCVGIRAGVGYDYERRVLMPTVGAYVEGFGRSGSSGPTYGAVGSLAYPFGHGLRASLQPELNLPVVDDRGNLTVAAGVASGPTSFHGSVCYRNLAVLSYGGCGRWYTDGFVAADLEVGVSLPLLLADFSSYH